MFFTKKVKAALLRVVDARIDCRVAEFEIEPHRHMANENKIVRTRQMNWELAEAEKIAKYDITAMRTDFTALLKFLEIEEHHEAERNCLRKIIR